MDSFKGFNLNKDLAIPIPPEFFSSLLPHITDLFELKTVLYLFWYFEQTEGEYPYFISSQLEQDPSFLSGFGSSRQEQIKNLRHSIHLAEEDNIILRTTEHNLGDTPVYFLNTPRGRQGLELLQNGSLKLQLENDFPVKLTKATPNIFKLYEENFGLITPFIAETLTELEENYPQEWIEEAFKEAIKNNVRKLRYVEVILKNWQEEGKHERTDRRRGKKDKKEYDPDRYIDGDFSDFIDH